MSDKEAMKREPESCRNCGMEIVHIEAGLHSKMDFPDGRYLHLPKYNRLCEIAEAQP